MRKCKVIILSIVLTLLVVISSSNIWAEERSIYVGDLIQLKIQAEDLTLDEIKDKFKDFELVNVSDTSNGYILTLRSFETGEKTIQLGDTEVKIIVKSTLDEIDRSEIYEGDLTPQGIGFYLPWKYIFICLIGVFLVTGCINLRLILKRRKASSISPYQNFLKGISELSIEQEDYLVSLTSLFKRYLELTYSFTIRGKTSTEIVNEVSRIRELSNNLTHIKGWLDESDYYKYSKATPQVAKKMQLMGDLHELVTRIDKTKEGVSA